MVSATPNTLFLYVTNVFAIFLNVPFNKVFRLNAIMCLYSWLGFLFSNSMKGEVLHIPQVFFSVNQLVL